MKRLVLGTMIVCTGTLMASCGGGKNLLSASSLAGEWDITEVEGKKLPEGDMPFIGFDVVQKRMYGNSGCNRMMGNFETDSLKPGALKFGQVGSTRMMCPDMETETTILNALNETRSFGVKEGKVCLLDENGKEVLLLKKR